MAKQYASVTEMISDSPLEESQRDEIAARIASRQIIKRLMALRATRGMSQKEVADRMKCSQSRISKLENGVDGDIKIGDMRDYLHALDHDMSLFVCPKQWKSFQQIKFHAFGIRRCLGQLVDLIRDDPEILQGVSKAHVETVLNLVKLVVDSAKTLPSVEQVLPEIIEANGSGDAEELGDSREPTAVAAP